MDICSITMQKSRLRVNLEALFWIIALIILALSDPTKSRHYSFYPPTLLFGIKSPGYNLGHSISYLFRGKITKSLKTHPLGVFTVIIITKRIVYLLKISNK